MTKILIIGKNGQLGRYLCRLTENLDNVTAWSREELDVSDVGSIEAKLLAEKADIIINASAYTDTKQAETDTETATSVNALAPAQMAKVAKQTGALLIHVSTDYVFDGKRRKPYVESDDINPLSAYGRSKAEGEQRIRDVVGDDYANVAIIRTSWVFSEFGNNFLKTMLTLSQEREQLQVIRDQHGAPTYAGHLAEVILAVVAKHQSGIDVSGLYHYSDRPACSWYDFANEIIEEAKAQGFPVITKQVDPISASQWPSPVERPEYGVLNSDKLSALLERPASPWQEGVRAVLLAMKS